MVTRIPVIFCIDVEPDPREIDPADPGNWDGFESTVQFFNELRPRIAEATGAPAEFNWFLRMDPQVERVYGSAAWVVQRYRDLIKTLENAGDEIGLHTHAWRWEESARRWVIDHGDQNWVEHCVRTSFNAYEEALGRPCRSFRFGDRWMNNQTMHLLESLGVEFDLTLEPGIRDLKPVIESESVTGSLPDYANAPKQPFRPSQKDFRRRANGSALNLWSIPISTGNRLIIKSGRLAPIRKAASVFKWRHQPLTLNPAIGTNEFNFILDRLLADHSTTYLAPVVRTDAAIRPSQRPKLKQNMETLRSHAKVGGFVFVKPDRAMELLKLPEGSLTHAEPVSKAKAAHFSST